MVGLNPDGAITLSDQTHAHIGHPRRGSLMGIDARPQPVRTAAISCRPGDSGPLAAATPLAIGWAGWPRSRLVALAAVAWAALNMVVGGLVTVLPLPILPFEPEQSATHYLAHLVYALGQAPLLVVGWRAARGSVSEPASA